MFIKFARAPDQFAVLQAIFYFPVDRVQALVTFAERTQHAKPVELFQRRTNIRFAYVLFVLINEVVECRRTVIRIDADLGISPRAKKTFNAALVIGYDCLAEFADTLRILKAMTMPQLDDVFKKRMWSVLRVCGS